MVEAEPRFNEKLQDMIGSNICWLVGVKDNSPGFLLIEEVQQEMVDNDLACLNLNQPEPANAESYTPELINKHILAKALLPQARIG
jgi:hypothetical protein